MFRKLTAALAATTLLLISLAVASPDGEAQQAPSASGLVVVESARSFEDTWTALTDALAANPNIGVISQVDHSAAAAAAGLTLEPNRVVFFGNPNLGTPIMTANRTAGIDLPQKMQVFQTGDRVFVAYNPTSYLSSRHATGAVPTLANIDGALASLAATATNTTTTPSSGGTASAGAGLTTTPSPNDFETTWDQLTAAIDASPANVAFTVDHAQNSGGALAPTRLVVFGNPAIGTPLMAQSPTAGIDLPLKMLVYVDDAGVTQVVASTPAFLQQRHGLAAGGTLDAATGAIANFTSAAIAPAAPTQDTAAEDTETDDTETDDPATEAPDTAAAAGEDEVLGVTELALTGADLHLTGVAASLFLAGGAMVIVGRHRRRTESAE